MPGQHVRLPREPPGDKLLVETFDAAKVVQSLRPFPELLLPEADHRGKCGRTERGEHGRGHVRPDPDEPGARERGRQLVEDLIHPRRFVGSLQNKVEHHPRRSLRHDLWYVRLLAAAVRGFLRQLLLLLRLRPQFPHPLLPDLSQRRILHSLVRPEFIVVAVREQVVAVEVALFHLVERIGELFLRERTHGVRRSSQRGSLGGRVRRRHHLQDPSRLSRLLGILLAASSGARHIRVLVSHRIEGLIHPRRALAGQIILTARSGGRARGCRTTERHEIVTVDRRHRQQSQERVGLAGVRDSPVLCLTYFKPYCTCY